jgi:hypothetical protein
MGYLQDFRAQLAEKLQELPEERRKAVLDFVAESVLTSYRNGQKSRSKEKAKEAQQKKSA